MTFNTIQDHDSITILLIYQGTLPMLFSEAELCSCVLDSQ